MGSLRFDLTIYGGKADEARVEASRLGSIIAGMSKDIRDVCRNVAPEDDATAREEKEASCRLYVVGLPQKGQSVTLPLATEESPAPWGEQSGRIYLDGLNELRSSLRRADASLPVGFSREILERVNGYFDLLLDYKGMAIQAQANGKPGQRVDFDANLRIAVQIKLSLIDEEEELPMREEPDRRLYGHSIQGVLYELSDPKYDDPDAPIRFVIDPHDGTRWVCRIKRSDAPEDIQELWRTSVVVEGVASIRPKKPEMEVKRLTPLRKPEPLKAFDRLMKLSDGLFEDESLKEVMDRIRER
jgi:hypothetical protein